MKITHSLKKKTARSFPVLTMAGIALFANSAHGLVLFSSGAKTWDNVTANWGSASGGPYNTAIWNSGTPDDAVFQGTAGTVTLAAPGVSVNDINFTTNGYLITSTDFAADRLTFVGATSTITTGAGITATIASVIDGSSSVRKEGAGILYLNPGIASTNPATAGPPFPGGFKNLFTGNFTLAEGTVRLSSQGQNGLGTGQFNIESGTTIQVAGNNVQRLNNSQYNLNGNFAVNQIGGNTLEFSTGNVTLGADVTVTVGSGIHLQIGQALPNVDGVIGDGGNGFGLSKAGAGRMTLNNQANTYTGKTEIFGGTLNAIRISNAGVNSSLGAATGADSVIDIHNGASLRAGRPGAASGPANVNTTNRVINLAGNGAGTATIFIGNGSGFGQDNDTTLILNSGITVTGTGPKTLALNINAGQTGGGDRSTMILNGGIPNASDGSDVSVAITVEGSQQTLGVVLNGINTYTGDTTVRSGGGQLTHTPGPGFTLGDNAGMLFDIDASGVNNQIRGINFQNNLSNLRIGSNIIQLNGDFTFDLTDAGTMLGDSWNIVDVASLNETFGPTFTVKGFSDIGSNLWQFTNTAATYQFSESTGRLVVSAVAAAAIVPEPSTLALLSFVGLAGLSRRRRNGVA